MQIACRTVFEQTLQNSIGLPYVSRYYYKTHQTSPINVCSEISSGCKHAHF